MTPRFIARNIAIASCLLVVVATAGSAATLDFSGQLPITLQIASDTFVFTLEGGGAAVVNPSSAGLHLTAASLGAGALSVPRRALPVTDPSAFPILGIQVTAANGAGLVGDSNGRLQGAVPLAGVAKICLFSPCSDAVANLQLPLSPIGRGGTVHVTGAVNLTVVGAPWTTGTANVGAGTLHGGAHGPASATSSTAQAGGDVNLVSPVFISSNIGAAAVWSGFARLGVSFGGLAFIDCSDGVDNDGDGLTDFPDDPGCTRAVDFSEQESGHACDDGVDNDGDGSADHPADSGCTSATDPSEVGDCQDGADNDGDGSTDFPADPGCASEADLSEREAGLACDDAIDNDGDGAADYPLDPGCTSSADASETGDCQNGVDDEGDGLVDFPADTGCTSGADGSEHDPTRICDDGIDNDGDGAADHPADPGCASVLDETESSQLACDDGLDNDGDGAIDFPDDLGCGSSLDDSERSPAYACDDGVDNDGDGVADFPSDLGCIDATDTDEIGQCQDGLDNDGDGLVDFPEDPNCADVNDPREAEVDVDFAGELPLTIGYAGSPIVFTLQGGGVAALNPNGIDFHLTEASIPAGALTVQHSTPVFPGIVYPIGGVQVTAANGAGHFTNSSGRLQGVMPLAGIAKFCLFGTCDDPVSNLSLPLSPIGRGGSAAGGGFTVVGAPWTTGTAAVGATTVHGGAHGPASATSSTAQPGGDLNLVTPVFISSDVGQPPIPVWSGFARLALSFGGIASIDCQDGVDNDGDGHTDFPTDPGCTRATDFSERQSGHACDDGDDNDGDGSVDFPADPGCSSASDASEATECADVIDNDGDGFVDFPDDPGCTNAADSSEREVGVVCDDGIDNDGDGLDDYPDDPGCASSNDTSEQSAVRDCDDGIDNDDDGLIDFPADPGCASPNGNIENAACNDTADNDGDGLIDLADPGCSNASDRSEQVALDIEWVYVGEQGNSPDAAANCPYSAAPENCGSVDHPYYMSEYEITNGQYAKFLNAVAATDPNFLYSLNMGSDALGGITRSGSSGSYGYAVKSGRENNPVVHVSRYDGLRFANWLQNGQPTGAQGPGTTETGAYTFSGEREVGARNREALFFLPTENEWYKAAYFDPGSASYFAYPTGTNRVPFSEPPPGGRNSANCLSDIGHRFALTGSDQFDPSFDYLSDVGAYTGSPSPYGTFDQGGNASELLEELVRNGNSAANRGGPWRELCVFFAVSSNVTTSSPQNENAYVGFRIARAAGECSNDLDDDGDGLIDVPDDPGCVSTLDNDEHSPTLLCDDGVDNDGDGAVDLADPGCPFPGATLENPKCNDGLDNDGDGLVDFDDPGCTRAWPYWEQAPCGLGIELALLIPAVSWLRGRRRRLGGRRL